MIFGAWLQVTVSPFIFIIADSGLLSSREMGIPFTQLVKPFGDNPSERFAPSCLRKILLNRTVPRTVRPFQGSHERCRLQHTLQETYASPERARGTAKRWRGAPPAPTRRGGCFRKSNVYSAEGSSTSSANSLYWEWYPEYCAWENRWLARKMR